MNYYQRENPGNNRAAAPTGAAAQIRQWVDYSAVYKRIINNYNISPYYMPDEKGQHVIVNVLNAYMVPLRKVNNHPIDDGSITLLSVTVSELDRNGNYKIKKQIIKYPLTLRINDTGAFFPIERSVVFSKVPPDALIRIEIEFYVEVKCLYPAKCTEKADIRLKQDFEYDRNKNAWRPINNLPYPLEKISIHKDNFAGATIDFTLYYRFSFDKVIYPISETNHECEI
ncbi:hypothetical protein [Coprobacter tertius]|uniref:Uncharacterized protein n=1 Tax=Coprobacter tertius TaxID=2944915 RepID=A0ABT1MGB9_9BACT|nr:hypothetical protein [Coprobacter tertius]MCP9611414.1 hypothetical protein [Coprobacter tertius]